MEAFLKYSSVALGIYSFFVIIMIYSRLKFFRKNTNMSSKSELLNRVTDIANTKNNAPKELGEQFIACSIELQRVPKNFQNHHALNRQTIEKAFSYPEKG